MINSAIPIGSTCRADYRRNFLAGGSFFFTVDPADRQLLQGDGFRKRSTHPAGSDAKQRAL